ncbi:TetR/AcrR family transcriptional regulator [Deinococcus sp.]|uniref:TetR/AcrR family transcriptional regulator n=1 Tax=Deinococcus sp. TaxID=47478 RepID=UPI003CC5879D
MTALEHRKRLAAADRRQQILEAAALLFVAQGFEAVSMADIAQLLKVARPTVYSYFISPEAVLDSLLNDRLQGLWTRLEAQIVALSAGTVSGAPPQMFAALFEFLLGEHQTLALLHCGGGPSFRARRNAFLGELARRLERLRPGLQRSAALPWLLTQLLDSVAFGAAALQPEEVSDLAQTLDIFIRGGVAALNATRGAGETTPTG